MPSGDWSDFKELVRARTDIVQLVGERVALQSRRGGRELVGLCPFHDDHDPSLRVDPERQSYKCWACGEGGDCFAFVQKTESVPFLEALELLATRAHLELPRRGGARSADGKPTRKESFDVLAWAESEYHTFLRTSSEAAAAPEYLDSRGFTKETIERFRLGFSPADGQFLQRRARGRFNSLQLSTVRLIAERSERDGFYDYFRGRVMFPIRDTAGRTVAFGGRVLPSVAAASSPKYVNSPESALFTKNRVVFALDVARSAVSERDAAVVMEGYADCIMAHQFGIANAVATLGTALTDNHVSALKRFTRKVILVFDGDKAGKEAAEKSLSRFLLHDVDLRILTLQTAKDPADFLMEQGAGPFASLIESAPEAWEYKLRTCIERIGLSSVDKCEQVFLEMLDALSHTSRFSGSERENLILTTVSRKLGLPEQRVRQLVVKRRQKSQAARNTAATRKPPLGPPASGGKAGVAGGALPLTGNSESAADATSAAPDAQIEAELLEMILADPATVRAMRDDVSVGDFKNDLHRKMLELCYRLSDAGVLPEYGELISAAEDVELKRLLVTLDGSARKKAPKLRVDCAVGQEAVAQGGGKHALLRGMIHLLKRRARTQEVSMGRMAASSGPPGTLDPAQRELLRRATEIHGDRAKAKTTI